MSLLHDTYIALIFGLIRNSLRTTLKNSYKLFNSRFLIICISLFLIAGKYEIKIIDMTTAYPMPPKSKIEKAIETWVKLYTEITGRDGNKSILAVKEIIYIDGQPDCIKNKNVVCCGLAYRDKPTIIVRADEWSKCGWRTLAHELTHRMLVYDGFNIHDLDVKDTKEIQKLKKGFSKFRDIMDFSF